MCHFTKKGMKMKKALIIEKAAHIAAITKKMLIDLGFDGIVVDNEADVLRVCKEEKPELVVMCYSVCQDDSAIFIPKMKKICHPKIIFCSSNTEPEKIQEALDAGVDEYIMKPFDHDILQSKIAMVGLL